MLYFYFFSESRWWLRTDVMVIPANAGDPDLGVTPQHRHALHLACGDHAPPGYAPATRPSTASLTRSFTRRLPTPTTTRGRSER